ncbi:AraC family transcriptional regulator [Jejuia spongiicola]|uniref:AraC family transcriptional regulator n=1 Tax=Jejuia spongiicola TaxID=2942207 RepID=A0ABT0QEV5_9FLAO|nr:GyrI-like domain-containing protein [Jejuia spongiicola]MCL6295128.1 AraC family transcriptional regulator [Jejuia spongiicola]
MKISEKEKLTDYQARINRVFKYIDENLDSDLSLDTVSKIAFFSPFHFHRIFKFITTEPLNAFVTRKRVEKSASSLIHKNFTISEISAKYGFKDNSSFTRTFKKYYGVSPTEFKKQNPNKFSKIRQLESKNGQEYPDYDNYICVINNLKKWIKMNAKIEIKKMPKMDLAYVSSIGPQNVADAYQKLIKWGTPQGLINEQTKMITIYHDSFKITEANKVRISACILLSKPNEIEGEIGFATIEEGKFIVGSFEIRLDEFEKSWTGLFVWMNENGYKKANRNPFEIYHNNFNEHPERKAIVDFHIPIE